MSEFSPFTLKIPTSENGGILRWVSMDHQAEIANEKSTFARVQNLLQVHQFFFAIESHPCTEAPSPL